MFRSVFALFGFLAFMPFIIEAATIGFVSSSGVWFSADPPFSGVAVKTYSVVLNNEYKQLTATIAFADNGQEFGRTTIVVPQEEARQIQVIWTPTYGKHTIAAKFVSAFVIDSSGNTKQLSQSEMDSFAPPISQSIDIDNDSDKDGIGDHTEISTYGTAPLKADTDDDGLNDYDEIFKYKTDPKKANTDGDGMNDGDEVRAGRNPLVQDDPPPPPAPCCSRKRKTATATGSAETNSTNTNSITNSTEPTTKNCSRICCKEKSSSCEPSQTNHG